MESQGKIKLLIVDDEVDMLRLLKRSLSTDLECEVWTAPNAYQAMTLLEEICFDVVLADIRMPGMDGMELLGRIKEEFPGLTVVLMTAYGTIDLAVQSIKQGAYDFITKPFEHEKLVHLLGKAFERSRLVQENLLLQRRIEQRESLDEMVGVSPSMQKIFDTIRLISTTDVTVLLTGESGTGKDMAARAIHRLSHRRNAPFIAVNCPNLPESILESELFGYLKGAFTHAVQDKKGLLREAQGGTIYFDEVGDISLTLQTKLLRMLHEKEIRPLGATKNIKVDVRIIASTNQDLPAKIKDNLFREDLFYRLNVMSLHMPPLRKRLEDIPILTEHFLRRFCTEFRREARTIPADVMRQLINYPWRGNVRELGNVISRLVLLSSDTEIRADDLGPDFAAPRACSMTPDLKRLHYKEAKQCMLERFHQEYLTSLLSLTGGNVTRAAKDCGLERQALQQIMRRYGVKSKHFHPEDEQGQR
jgi:DNA-binding NtrC family response regulator